MAIADLKVRFTPDTSLIESKLAELGRNVSKKVKPSVTIDLDAERKAREAVEKSIKQSYDKQAQLAKLNTKELIQQAEKLQSQKKEILKAIEKEEDTSVKRILILKKKGLDQELREYKEAALKRDEVLRKGAGASIGILGTGRNVTGSGGGAGILNIAGATYLAKEALGIGKEIFNMGKEIDDANDAVSISLKKVGGVSAEVAAQMQEDAKQTADDFAMKATDVKKLQAIVAGYGGQVGKANKDIIELAIATSHSIGVPAENLAKMFAKATDPENEASLAKLGLVFEKGATQQERWTAIQKRFGGAVQEAKDSTHDAYGDMARVTNSLEESIGELSNEIMTNFAPVLKDLMPIIKDVIHFLSDLGETVGIILGRVDEAELRRRKYKEAGLSRDQLVEQRYAENLAVQSIAAPNMTIVEKAAFQKKARRDAEVYADSFFKEAENESLMQRINANYAKLNYGDTTIAGKAVKDAKEAAAKATYESEKAELLKKLSFEISLQDELVKQGIRSEEEAFQEKLKIQEDYFKSVITLATKYANLPEAVRAQQQLNNVGVAFGPAKPISGAQGINGIPNGALQKANIGEQPLVGMPIGYQEAIDAALEETDNKARRLQSIFENAFGNLWNTINQGFFEPMKNALHEALGAFGDFVASILQDLATLGEELLAKAAIFGLLSIFLPGSSFISGGLMKFLGFAKGGTVPGRDYGYDTVPTMLQPGEYVIPKAMAQSIGYDRLDRSRMQHLATGGMVKASDGITVTLINPGGIRDNSKDSNGMVLDKMLISNSGLSTKADTKNIDKMLISESNLLSKADTKNIDRMLISNSNLQNRYGYPDWLPLSGGSQIVVDTRGIEVSSRRSFQRRAISAG